MSGSCEEQISYSDNSHICGVPFVVWEELHGYATVPRGGVRDFLERTMGIDVEFHIRYEGAE